MSVVISCGDERKLWVANKRMDSLVAFACDVALDRELDERMRGVVEQLRLENDQGWSWRSFDLEEVFEPQDRRSFAEVFAEVAERVFRRELGNQEIDDWQASLIADAYWISRALRDASSA